MNHYYHFKYEHKGYEYIRIRIAQGGSPELANKEIEATDKQFIIIFRSHNELYLKHDGKTINVSEGETEQWNVLFERLGQLCGKNINFHKIPAYWC